MTSDSVRAGRPRSFDEAEIVDDAVNVFWKHGSDNATTRVLENELGITQSSIYNAFGSKQGLLERALDRYVERIDDEVVGPLDVEEAGAVQLNEFIDRLMTWIGNPNRPGCLLLNMLGERQRTDASLVARSHDYRDRLRRVFRSALSSYGQAAADARAEVLLASVLGINISAYGGAHPDELDALANGVRTQLEAWTTT